MEFHTISPNKRPVRLKESTRQFAWESLHGKYGDITMSNYAIHMDNVPEFDSMTEYEQYDRAIMKIAQEAPVRICAHERVSGAATLGLAIRHHVPAMCGGRELWYGVSHLTLGFDRVVNEGLNAIEAEALRLTHDTHTSRAEIPHSILNTIAAIRIWRDRYLINLKDIKPDIHIILTKVPFKPANSFHEAVQSLWFMFAFTRLCGNWSGIGRIDALLGSYLKRDLERGVETIDSAREILASFFIKGCEWIEHDTQAGSGDAQHYQNIVLAGVDADGNDITNEVTFLVLDVIEELGIGDFPIAIRVSEKTSHALLTKIAEVMRHGGGIVAVYNEPIVIKSLVDFGYPLEEARDFANDGCWEVQIPGMTKFSYIPIDSMTLLLENTLKLSSECASFDSMDALYDAFLATMRQKIEEIYNDTVMHFTGQMPGAPWQWRTDSKGTPDWVWAPMTPCSVVSMLEEGCAESGRSYLCGGTRYVVVSPHIGGAPDVGNSLYAIQKLVFDEKKVSFAQLMQILKNNWEGFEELRQYAVNKFSYYGNDNDEADGYTVRVLHDFADYTAGINGRCPVQFPAGISTFGRQIEWASSRAATPFGRKRGEILSGGASPTPGTDMEGATAVIKSYCKIDHTKITNGSALDLKLHPSAVKGSNGVNVLIALVKGFVKLGGFFMQLDIMDANILHKAQQHPEAYKTLSVRVSGWNARFVTLDPHWQKMIIDRTAYGI